MRRNLVTSIWVRIVGVEQHFQVHKSQRCGLGQNQVVVLVPAILDQAQIGFRPRQTVVALGVGGSPAGVSHLVLGVVVNRHVPHAELARFANHRAIELHAHRIGLAGLSAAYHGIGCVLHRCSHLQPQILSAESTPGRRRTASCKPFRRKTRRTSIRCTRRGRPKCNGERPRETYQAAPEFFCIADLICRREVALLGDEKNPAHAEPVGDHAEARREECLLSGIRTWPPSDRAANSRSASVASWQETTAKSPGSSACPWRGRRTP